jgi:formylglycine-generating enzyme required for sulfatase activity
VSVQAFRAEHTLVSNGAFLEFIQAGGYLDPQWWTEAGWDWRSFRNSKWPCFWISEGPAGLHRYRLRTLFETIPMPWNWPAEVNAHEAAAYCAWRSARDGQPCRLPTEAEHNALRDPAWAGSDPAFRMDGATLGREIGWNSQLAHGSPWPVDAGKPAPSGAHDVFGNVWQWHGDDFNPLPGARSPLLRRLLDALLRRPAPDDPRRLVDLLRRRGQRLVALPLPAALLPALGLPRRPGRPRRRRGEARRRRGRQPGV